MTAAVKRPRLVKIHPVDITAEEAVLAGVSPVPSIAPPLVYPPTVKERSLIACLSAMLANPDVFNHRVFRQHDRAWLTELVDFADEISDLAVLRLPREGRGE